MQRGYVDIAASRLEDAAYPSRAQTGYPFCQAVALQPDHLHSQGREARGECLHRIALLRATDRQRGARREHTQLMEFRSRRGGQRLHAGTAIAFGPEGG